jgi:hypothetical protein
MKDNRKFLPNQERIGGNNSFQTHSLLTKKESIAKKNMKLENVTHNSPK